MVRFFLLTWTVLVRAGCKADGMLCTIIEGWPSSVEDMQRPGTASNCCPVDLCLSFTSALQGLDCESPEHLHNVRMRTNMAFKLLLVVASAGLLQSSQAQTEEFCGREGEKPCASTLLTYHNSEGCFMSVHARGRCLRLFGARAPKLGRVPLSPTGRVVHNYRQWVCTFPVVKGSVPIPHG